MVNQKLVLRLLEKRGHHTTLAANGLEVLDLLGTKRFDVVLMDVQMPVMDGVEAVMEIRRREVGTARHVPVYAVTANAMKGDREHYLASGMDGYLSQTAAAGGAGQAAARAGGAEDDGAHRVGVRD